jgi:hypothetical protein
MEGSLLRSDGTTDCDACGLPLFPYAIEIGSVHLECANHHHASTPLPRDEAVRRAVESWIARRGAQLHEQHERWGTDDEDADA